MCECRIQFIQSDEGKWIDNIRFFFYDKVGAKDFIHGFNRLNGVRIGHRDCLSEDVNLDPV